MNKTPQTQKEFIDYRFNETINSIEGVKTETNKGIDEVKAAVKSVQDQLQTSFATKDYVDGKYDDHEKRLADLEDDRQWAVRLVLGFIFMGILYTAVHFK